ncbi:hypothetical protein B0H14DRAFT_3150253, partial [Mycena olivaceomarginata]
GRNRGQDLGNRQPTAQLVACRLTAPTRSRQVVDAFLTIFERRQTWRFYYQKAGGEGRFQAIVGPTQNLYECRLALAAITLTPVALLLPEGGRRGQSPGNRGANPELWRFYYQKAEARAESRKSGGQRRTCKSVALPLPLSHFADPVALYYQKAGGEQSPGNRGANAEIVRVSPCRYHDSLTLVAQFVPSSDGKNRKVGGEGRVQTIGGAAQNLPYLPHVECHSSSRDPFLTILDEGGG